MELLVSAASPYSRTARVALRETGLTGHVTEVMIATTPLASDPRLASANPSGRIPTLLREDGPAIHDSRVIVRYFDHLAEARLYAPARLWEILTLEATGHGLMDAAISAVYEARFKGTEGRSAEWIEAQWAKVLRSLGALEARWMSHLAGPLDAGQIAVGCGLGYLDLRFADRDWRGEHPSLAAWFERFDSRPAMVETRPA